MQVLGRLSEAAQLVERQHLLPLFKRYGLNGGEFDVLATLRRAGAPFALTPTALYQAMMISSGGVTNRIDRLERAGHIERAKNPADRRGVLVQLTATGKETIDTMLGEHVANQTRVLAGLTEKEQAKLDRLLDKLIRHLPTPIE
ncbi:MarR family transcriptional regulator [Endozoicomonas sp. G2_2]|uniref:MarR family winged helix-turn-helix transcriptional regulator n=1 Tax=Endozoicomonas sp. G2_2 TaxID=2821092 RepID=UPI001FFE0A65|nr:MarR family transcriptional regulator [Endozoicomonas sp. G2_2]